METHHKKHRCLLFRLADLSIEFELEKVPTVDDLLTVIVNREDVENLINKPVSIYSYQSVHFMLWKQMNSRF